MQVRQLQTEEIKEVYEQYLKETFPEAELKPFWKIQEAICLGVYQCYGLFKMKSFVVIRIFYERTEERRCIVAGLLCFFTTIS